MNQQFLLRLPASGGAELIPVSTGVIPDSMLCSLLQTDMTERMRVPVLPEILSDSARVLCYFIDARGGDKGLPVNTPGTCFYHTGCPIFGDLLLALCDQNSDSGEIHGFSEQECIQLKEWLHQQLPVYFEY